MKVILLANARSGSHSLFNFIGSHLRKINKKYITLHEPFNDSPKFAGIQEHIKNIESIKGKDNILIKSLMQDQYPYESFQTWEEYIKWVFEYFDKIIFLDRKDKIKQCESVFYHTKINEKISINYTWHTPKVYNLTNEDTNGVQSLVEHFENSGKKMLEYSNMYNVPIFYYEDIFLDKNKDVIKKLLNYLTISEINPKAYNEWIDNQYKIVRIDKKTNNLI